MPDEEDDIPLDLILKEEQIEVIANGTMATDEKGRAITMVSIFMQTITNNPTGTRTDPNGTCTILHGVVRIVVRYVTDFRLFCDRARTTVKSG